MQQEGEGERGILRRAHVTNRVPWNASVSIICAVQSPYGKRLTVTAVGAVGALVRLQLLASQHGLEEHVVG